MTDARRQLVEVAVTSPLVRLLSDSLHCVHCGASVLFSGPERRFYCRRDERHDPSPNINRRLAATLARRARKSAANRRASP